MKNANKPDYQSLLVIVVGMVALSYIFKSPILVKVGLAIGILSLLSRQLASWILYIWHKLAELLGWINTRILLTAVFFLVVFPFSLLYKLITKNPLSLRNRERSVFAVRDHTYTKKDLENTW
jgi:hypothetical protein